MNSQLATFFAEFQRSFHPRTPKRARKGFDWQVSAKWSADVRRFLDSHFTCQSWENPSRRCAAIIFDSEGRDYGVIWMWDHNKVLQHFSDDGFRELLSSRSTCGVAIVHTRAEGELGAEMADESIKRIANSYHQHLRDNRAVGLIAIRRTDQDRNSITFCCVCTDLSTGETIRFDPWTFSDPD